MMRLLYLVILYTSVLVTGCVTTPPPDKMKQVEQAHHVSLA